jgi:large subunit ribosomal protein L31
MKKGIHPTWYPEAIVKCACGNTFTMGSTKAEIKTDICDKCHPFFTGKMKFIDTLGRVEKFQKAQTEALKHKEILDAKKKKKSEKEQQSRQSKSLREMLMSMK